MGMYVRAFKRSARTLTVQVTVRPVLQKLQYGCATQPQFARAERAGGWQRDQPCSEPPTRRGSSTGATRLSSER